MRLTGAGWTARRGQDLLPWHARCSLLPGSEAEFSQAVVPRGPSRHADPLTRCPAIVRRGPPGVASAGHPRLRDGLHPGRDRRSARPGPGDRSRWWSAYAESGEGRPPRRPHRPTGRLRTYPQRRPGGVDAVDPREQAAVRDGIMPTTEFSQGPFGTGSMSPSDARTRDPGTRASESIAASGKVQIGSELAFL